MSHPEQTAFLQRVKEQHPHYFAERVSVLEIGSLNINGTARDLFATDDYIGVDLAEGPGVNVIANGATVDFVASFDVVLSCECFEHNALWLPTFVNMWRQCTGLLLFTTATTGRGEHGTHANSPDASPHTNGYYRNITIDDVQVLPLTEMFAWHTFEIDTVACDLYFVGEVKGNVRQ